MSDSSDVPEIPLPRWPFRQKESLSGKLHRQVFGRWLGEKIDSEVMMVLIDDVCLELELDSIKARQAATDTMAQYFGRQLDETLNRQLCMQFAWNNEVIREGRSLRKFTSVTEYTWLPFQIGDVKDETLFGQDAAKLYLLCLGSFAAGYVTTKIVPWNFLRFFAYQLGFNRRWPYDDKPKLMLGMRFAGLVEPSEAADLKFHRYHLTGAMKKRNKAIIHDRAEDAWEEARLH